MSLAALAAGGCVDVASQPVRPVAAVADDFAAAIRGCATPLGADHGIDRAAVKAAGWRPVAHILSTDGKERPIALDAEPRVGPGQYESLTLARAGREGRLDLTDYGAWEPDRDLSGQRVPGGLADECRISASIRREDAPALRTRLARSLGAAPRSLGELPRGGDFLMPRFDKAATGWSWQRPQHDILLSERGPDVALTVTAVPRRLPESPTIQNLKDKGIIQ